jgi:hypothetical protein
MSSNICIKDICNFSLGICSNISTWWASRRTYNHSVVATNAVNSRKLDLQWSMSFSVKYNYIWSGKAAYTSSRSTGSQVSPSSLYLSSQWISRTSYYTNSSHNRSLRSKYRVCQTQFGSFWSLITINPTTHGSCHLSTTKGTSPFSRVLLDWLVINDQKLPNWVWHTL